MFWFVSPAHKTDAYRTFYVLQKVVSRVSQNKLELILLLARRPVCWPWPLRFLPVILRLAAERHFSVLSKLPTSSALPLPICPSAYRRASFLRDFFFPEFVVRFCCRTSLQNTQSTAASASLSQSQTPLPF